jgi:hypothetical protein
MIESLNNNIIQNAGYAIEGDEPIQHSIIEEINKCIDEMDKTIIKEIIIGIDKDAIKKYEMLAATKVTQTPATTKVTQTPAATTKVTQTPTATTKASPATTTLPATTKLPAAATKTLKGGNNNKILKKNIVRLYNYYLLSQDQNNLSYKIKKKLDKKIAELKNLVGGAKNDFINEFVKTLKSKKYISYINIQYYIKDNKILDYLKKFNIIDNNISNTDCIILFHNSGKDIMKNIIKSIIEYYFKLIMESIDISKIISEIIKVDNICPNKTIDDCFKSFLKNNMKSNKYKYKEKIYTNKEEQIITIIIFILIYIFNININNTIDIASFFNRKTIINQGIKIYNSISSIILSTEQDKEITKINNIFYNKNFIDEYNDFISKNESIRTIIPDDDSKKIFNEKYEKLKIKAAEEAKIAAEEAAKEAAKEATRNRKKWSLI